MGFCLPPFTKYRKCINIYVYIYIHIHIYIAADGNIPISRAILPPLYPGPAPCPGPSLMPPHSQKPWGRPHDPMLFDIPGSLELAIWMALNIGNCTAQDPENHGVDPMVSRISDRARGEHFYNDSLLIFNTIGMTPGAQLGNGWGALRGEAGELWVRGARS